MKKNTLLYLEKNLVERAKKANVNISEIAEKALKEALEERRDRTDPSYIFDNAEARYLPYTIKKICLNHPMFDKGYGFQKTNLIVGGNGSGKTLMLKLLSRETTIKASLETSSKGIKLIDDFYECVLIDNALSPLTNESRDKFISWLKDKFKTKQIMLTSLEPLQGFENIINLKKKINILSSEKILALCNERASLREEIDNIRKKIQSKNRVSVNDRLRLDEYDKRIACIYNELNNLENKMPKR